MLARIRSYWRGLFHRRLVERDLEDELRMHLEERSESLERLGLTPPEARRQARIEFGPLASYQERCREARGLRWPDELRQDLRYAFRMARKSPAVTTVAVLSLALGIGANTGIFSILNSLLLVTLPVRDPGRVVILQTWRPQGPGATSYPLYLRLRDGLRGKALEDVCAASSPQDAAITLPGGDSMTAVQENVTANYFDVLGVPLIAGRSFQPGEDHIGSQAVAVISERLWRNRLASDPAILGKMLTLDERPVTVIGIAGGAFAGVEIGNSVDLWANVTAFDTARLQQPGWNSLNLFARLRPKVTVSQAQAALQTVYEAYQRERIASTVDPRSRQFAAQQHMSVESGATGVSKLRQRFGLPLRICLGVVALVLLIACTNISNLLLARTAARQREIATRLAIGAGASRLFRQFLAESLLLSVCGGLLGLAVATWTSTRLLHLIPQGPIPLALDVHLSLRVLLFAAGVAIGAGLLFGIVPAMRVGRSELVQALKFSSAAHFGGGRGRARAGKLLSVAQVALSTLLVFGAGLFVRTLLNLRTLDSGFRAEHVVTFDVNFPRGYSEERKSETQRQVVDRVAALPGVVESSICWPGPFNGGRFSGSVRIPGKAAPEDPQQDIDYMLIGPRFFSTMGSALAAGRDFDSLDFANHAAKMTAAIINQSMARTYFPGKNPVGMKIQPFPQAPEPVFAEIIGVVPDIRHFGMREKAAPAVYLPITEMALPWAPTFEVRLGKDLASASHEIQRAVAGIDSRLRAEDIATMDQRIDEYLEKERMLATVASLFSVIALVLAAGGLYGVMAYAVTRRTKEIGLRMALGAQRRQMLGMILRDGSAVAVAGVGLGIPAALALSRLLSSLLFGVKPGGASALVTAVAIMLGVAAMAMALPAWRASRVDPMASLREE